MHLPPMFLALAAITALSGCGSEAAAPETKSTDKTGDGPAATETAKIAATVEEVQQAWKCRGLISAASAAKTILKDDMPPELAEISTETALYWTTRAAQLEAPDMTEAQENEAIVTGTRVLATRQAVEENLPDIKACLAAQKAQ